MYYSFLILQLNVDKFGLSYTGMKILTLVTVMNRFFKKQIYQI